MCVYIYIHIQYIHSAILYGIYSGIPSDMYLAFYLFFFSRVFRSSCVPLHPELAIWLGPLVPTVTRAGRGQGGGGGGGRVAPLLKSRDPHLAGGEKHRHHGFLESFGVCFLFRTYRNDKCGCVAKNDVTSATTKHARLVERTQGTKAHFRKYKIG